MSHVRVCCRFRPQNALEISQGGREIVSFQSNKSLEINAESTDHTFSFDRVFASDSTQTEVFEYAARPIVEDVLKGYNGTIFAYGQTSSGKTFTMQGPDINDAEKQGIIPRMVGAIFDAVAEADENIEFQLKVSYLEIYLERIRDLFDITKENLQIREDKARGVWVNGATEVYVGSEEEVMQWMEHGAHNRQVSATNMNTESSRSHSIFVMTVVQKNMKDLSTITGKLYLVDLAGSEKVSKTGAEGDRLTEAKNINKSLSTLGKVINALTDSAQSHVPYRDSKLTRVLQNSLGGNCRTALIINCSPSSFNEMETMSTLRFGMRAKNIKNKPIINQERSPEELKMLLRKAEETIQQQRIYIRSLEEELRALGGGDSIRDSFIAGKGSEDPDRKSLDMTPDEAARELNLDEATAKRLPNVVKLHKKLEEYESRLQEEEEEKLALLELQDALLDQLQDKNSEIQEHTDTIAALKKQVTSMRGRETSHSKENEMLLQKLTDLTMQNEKAKYETQEKNLTAEQLAADNASLRKQLGAMQTRMDQLEKGQTAPMEKTLPLVQRDPGKMQTDIAESTKRWTSKEDEMKAKLEQQMNRLEDASTTLEEDDRRAAELEAKLDEEVSSLDSDADDITSEQRAAQRARITELLSKAEKGDEQAVKKLRKLVQEHGDRMEAVQRRMSKYKEYMKKREAEWKRQRQESNEKHRQLEDDFRTMKSQLVEQLEEFSTFKSSLVGDLQERCEKVIELEQALEDARGQYNELVKNSSNKALKSRIQFLERNLEQLTYLYQQQSSQYAALKVENQVAEKKIARKNERIQILELLLQDARERNEKLRAVTPSGGSLVPRGRASVIQRSSSSDSAASQGSSSAQENASQKLHDLMDAFTRFGKRPNLDLSSRSVQEGGHRPRLNVVKTLKGGGGPGAHPSNIVTGPPPKSP